MMMIRIHMGIDTGFASATHKDYVEYEEDYWNCLTEEQKEKVMDQDCQDFIQNRIEAYVSKVEIV